MKRIHKFVLSAEPGAVEVRFGGGERNVKMLSVGVQRGKVVVWYEFEANPDTSWPERWNVSLVWTGTDFIPYGDYVGTVTDDDGLVYHVYAGRL